MMSSPPLRSSLKNAFSLHILLGTTRFRNIVRVLVFLGFLLLIIRMINLSLLREILSRVRVQIIIVGVVIYFGNIAIRAYRWKRIFRFKELPHISFKDLYILTLIGMALNMVIPATLGDIARSYYGYKMFGFKEEMLSTVLVDKIFALCSLFLLGGISGYLMEYNLLGTIAWLAALLTLIPLAFPHIVPWKWLNAALKYIHKSFDPERLIHAFTLPFRLKVEVMTISMIGWLCTCIYFYVICVAFSAEVSLWYVFVIMPMLTTARLFPFTLNSLGPMELASVYFLSNIGIEQTLALCIALSSNLLASALPGLVGVIFILSMRRRTKTS